MPLFGQPNIEKLKGKRNVKGLINALRHKDAKIRVDAARALGVLGDALAVSPLIAALNDEDVDVRRLAAGALRELGDAGVDPLIAALTDKHESVRTWAAQALGRIGHARAVEPLIAALEDESSYPRALARTTAGGSTAASGAPTGMELLLAAQKAEYASERSVRRAIATALKELQDERAVEPLMQWITSELLGAGEALVELDDAQMWPLIAALTHRNQTVRRQSAWSLGQLGGARAVEPLIAALKDNDAEVCRAAEEALKRIGGPGAERALAQYHARQK